MILALQKMGELRQIWLQNTWGYITDISKYHKAGIWSMD